jgi:hypothetical protein
MKPHASNPQLADLQTDAELSNGGTPPSGLRGFADVCEAPALRASPIHVTSRASFFPQLFALKLLPYDLASRVPSAVAIEFPQQDVARPLRTTVIELTIHVERAAQGSQGLPPAQKFSVTKISRNWQKCCRKVQFLRYNRNADKVCKIWYHPEFSYRASERDHRA